VEGKVVSPVDENDHEERMIEMMMRPSSMMRV
jgi:hypothetical protein